MSTPTYVGDVTFALKPGSTLTQDAWGMDVLTRVYEGKNTLLEAFLAGYGKRRDVADSEFPWLYYTSANCSIGRAFTQVTLTFKGLNNPGTNNSPIPLEPVIKSGCRTDEVQLQYIGDTLGETTGATTSLTYNHPYSRYYYITRERPTARSFKNQLELTDEAIRFESRSGFPGPIALFAGASWRKASGQPGKVATLGDVQSFNGIVEVLTTEFTWEPAGQWYECTEVNEARIIPLDLASGLLEFAIR